MRVPYFRAKDQDSDQFVEGFYVEFPESSDVSKESKLIHAIMVVVPDMGAIPMMPMLGLTGGDQKPSGKNTLNFCTIDINTLKLVGEVEIGDSTFKPNGYIKQVGSNIIL